MVLYKIIFLVAIVTPMIYQVHGSNEIVNSIPIACRKNFFCTEEDFVKENLTINNPLFETLMKKVTLRLAREAAHPNQPWFIVPYNSKYKQTVYTQKCVSESSSCFDGFMYQDESKAVCVQEYTAMVVHVLDEATKKIRTLEINLPAYCSCKIQNNKEDTEQDSDYDIDNYA